MKSPRRIIISRTDSIGDVVLTLPVAGALKKHFPDCTVIFLGSSYTKPIVECCPYVDEFADWHLISQLSEKEQIKYFQSLNADTILHIFPRKEIAKLAQKSNITTRVGTSHRSFHWFTCNRRINLSRRKSDLHEAQLNLKLLEPLGLTNVGSTLEEVQQYLSLVPKATDFEALKLLTPDRFNLIFHPKSNGSGREWGIENFQRLLEILPKDRYRVFICGTAKEKALMGDLANVAAENVVQMCGRLTLDEYVAFIAAADGLIASGTGPLHVAAAVGTNAIGLYPPMRPIHPGRWQPIGPKVKVFCADKACEDCRKNGDCACMRSITPESVLDYLNLL